MNAMLILKTAVAATGVAVTATFAGAGFAAAASDPGPETTLTVQDGGTVYTAPLDGASIDGDGTQGQIVGPLEAAKPQIKASASTAKNGP